MINKYALSVKKLSACLPPNKVPFATSDAITKSNSHLPQQRALEALELALHIKTRGYNIYLAGEPDLGRSYLLREYLTPRAKKENTPPDLVYLYNFEDNDAPVLAALPAGQGKKLRAELSKLLASIKKEILARLERTQFTTERHSIYNNYQARREQLFTEMNKIADNKGFILDVDESGSMTLYPLIDGKRLNEQEYEKLGTEKRSELKKKGETLTQPMTALLQNLAKAEQFYLEAERGLEKDLVEKVLQQTFDPIATKQSNACKSEVVDAFFTKLRSSTLENLDALMPIDGQLGIDPQAPQQLHHGQGFEPNAPEDISAHFSVNVFVSHAPKAGAPIIACDHPTLANLMGCIERQAEMGALVTDFTLIKAGAIHKANGGYLILHMDDMLHHSAAWEALLRALRSGLSRIEDANDEEVNKTKGLEPEPVPLSLKVILVGREELHEMLLHGDERFGKLFKIKAHLTEYMPRDNTNIRVYLSHCKSIIDKDHLLPFDREALAALVDHGSRLIEDQQKLSLMFPRIRELMVEASAYATLNNSPIVTKDVLTTALFARDFRSNLVEEAFMEEYDRKIIKVVTSGKAVGKVNGLAVSSYGDFEFGLPHQISCTVGVGQGGIIDLERDAQLGGPIHTKAMMILKTYLVGAFAHNKPLILTGSLGFEQNYVGIEGDSASGAELAALLSALSEVPINLSLAFTGAVSQTGEIMAVGGVTRKIEGYFEVCKRHGLTGQQGVILPKDNVAHLMLNDEVVKAVEDGLFTIYGVEHISQALSLLVDIPCGKKGKNGSYTKGSLYDLVDKRLAELAKIYTQSLYKRR